MVSITRCILHPSYLSCDTNPSKIKGCIFLKFCRHKGHSYRKIWRDIQKNHSTGKSAGAKKTSLLVVLIIKCIEIYQAKKSSCSLPERKILQDFQKNHSSRKIAGARKFPIRWIYGVNWWPPFQLISFFLKNQIYFFN